MKSTLIVDLLLDVSRPVKNHKVELVQRIALPDVSVRRDISEMLKENVFYQRSVQLLHSSATSHMKL